MVYTYRIDNDLRTGVTRMFCDIAISRSLATALLATAAHLGNAGLAHADDGGQWTMAARDYASTRFSPLGQLTPANVNKLQVAFTFSMGVNRGQEAAPLVVGDTMYLIAPYPNYLYAL